MVKSTFPLLLALLSKNKTKYKYYVCALLMFSLGGAHTLGDLVTNVGGVWKFTFKLPFPIDIGNNIALMLFSFSGG